MATRKTSPRPAPPPVRGTRSRATARRSREAAAPAAADTPPAAKAAVKPRAAAPAKEPKEVKDAKPPKLHRKPVRDSFTMPEADFALIATLKARALAGQRETKKSELLRAGLHALALLDTPGLVVALSQLEPVKIGRPKKHH